MASIFILFSEALQFPLSLHYAYVASIQMTNTEAIITNIHLSCREITEPTIKIVLKIWTRYFLHQDAHKSHLES